MSVHIVQTLCPARHCILALAYESDIEEAQPGADTANARMVEGAVDSMIRRRHINPWCGLCKAPRETWTTEDRKTKFATMAEARPELERLEQEQALTRAMLGEAARH